MILGIDQGTTGSTAVLLSDHGRVLGAFTSAVPQHYPRPAWVEHHPEEIWKSVRLAIAGVMKKANAKPHQISAIGITNQRETVSLFDGARPLHRFIVWQDRRTSATCERLKKHETLIRSRSGLTLDPYFSASKIQWLLKKLKPSLRNRNLRFRTIDSFLFQKLCQEDAIELTNASRTSLLNLRKRIWDPQLFETFDIPLHMAPRCVPSEGFHFKTKNSGILPDGIPVVAAMGDQQAALFGQLGWRAGEGKMTYGTGSFILLNTGETCVHSKNRLISTLAIEFSNGKSQFALEGSAFISGAWIQWLRDQLRIISNSGESESLAREVSDSAGVFVIPALAGLGAPFWNPHARGAILGLTRGTSRAHLVRASLEALSFQNKALVDAMAKDYGKTRLQWRVDGGAVKNDLLLQIQADVLKTTLIRPKNLEATATGVALLAAYSRGILSMNEIAKSWNEDRRFKPKLQSSSRLLRAYKNWILTAQSLPCGGK